MKQIQRAFLIPDMNVEEEINDDDILQFKIYGENDDYVVHCDHGLWRCNCEDYSFAPDKDLGSYTCKHIIKCILYLKRMKEKEEDIKKEAVMSDEFITASRMRDYL